MKQVWIFYLLACGISWLIWLPLYGPALGIHGLPVWPFHHGTGGLGPLLAAVCTTWYFSGKKGVGALLAACRRLHSASLFLIALLAPLVLLVAGIWLQVLVSGQPVAWTGLWQSREFPSFSLPAFFAYNLLFFGFGEEMGWRGFLLPRLQQRRPAFSAALLLSLFWAVWHAPLFLYRPGYMTMSAAGALGWVFSLFTGSILLSWLYNTSRGSILLCAIFHTTIDLAFTSQLSSPEVSGFVGMFITIWGIGTVLVFGTRRLSRTRPATE